MNVAIVGAGTMGRDWADALTTARLAKIAAIVDPLIGTDDAPRWLASYPDAATATAVERLDCDDIEVAVITASTPAHAALIETSLRRGFHVIVEKPITQTIADAERVVELADELDSCLMVSQNYRYFPGVRTLRNLLADGGLGVVRSVSGQFWCDWKGRPYQHAMDHVMALEMAVHHFDLVRAIFGAEAIEGRVTEWNPDSSPYRSGSGLEALFTMQRPGGSFPFHYSGSLVGHAPRTPWGGTWRIEFDRGTVLVDDVDGDYGVHVCLPDGAPTQRLGPFAADTMMLDASFRHFATCVRERTPPWSSGRDNLGTMRMALGFQTSAPGTTALGEESIP